MRIAVTTSEATRPLRRAILRPGFPDDASTLVDPPDAVHIAAFEADDVIGSAVVHLAPFAPQPDVAAVQLRGMAVSPERQRAGVGGRLLEAVLDLAASLGAEIVWCNARTTAADFYAGHGWRIDGDEFVGAVSLPHLLMWRPVGNQSGTPSRPTD